MIIWVKEFEDCTVEYFRNLIKKQHAVLFFVSFDLVDPNDVIIYSEKDSFGLDKRFANISFQRINEGLVYNFRQEVQNNYDRCYMLAALERIKYGAETVCVGNSCMQFGFHEQTLPKSVNCSLASQDLYYDMKILEKIINISTLKNLIIGLPWYQFHVDLSKETRELFRIQNVYYPIFNDMHNAFFIESAKNFSMISDFIDVEKVMLKNYVNIMSNGYFSNGMKREYSTVANWSSLSISEKETIGLQRANSHNKNLQYISTFKENVHIFDNIINLCQSNNISVFIVIPPVADYYIKNLDNDFQKYYLSVLKNYTNQVKIIDLTSNNSFSDSDFSDQDHLNEQGAIKLTTIIKKYLENV